MNIEVQLFATLTQYLPPETDGRRAFLTVPEGATVGEALAQLGVPRKFTKLIFIDSVHQKPDTVLQDGNVLSIFPPIAGG
jgi:molybdopterin converting factor small subunit